MQNILPKEYTNTIISAISIVCGALIGAICSSITTKRATSVSIAQEDKIFKKKQQHNQKKEISDICKEMTIIRLDICNALFQSIRALKQIDKKENIYKYPIPINKDYSHSVAVLTSRFELKEMSCIYQLYAIIEKMNKHIQQFSGEEVNEYCIKIDYEIFLQKIYGSNFKKVLQFDVEVITYKELYDNNLIKEEYRCILQKIDKIIEDMECSIS
ncbi:hypothetical protein ACFIJ5_16315 [Haloimpatiens sp. FM7330]|uniref:hypothetical protein n=1 Tax=Haloimpatiens sp. FM7330 TaxID=3298610 RepID=UPI00363A76C1